MFSSLQKIVIQDVCKLNNLIHRSRKPCLTPGAQRLKKSPMSEIRSICVYCGSSTGQNPLYREAGLALGRSIAEHGIRLVYGGGTRGIMGAVAQGVMEAGGEVTGIIPTFLLDKEASLERAKELSELIIVDDMHERKHLMFQRSDAFVTLPGGIGTVEEIVEMMTWAQLGKHRKPMVFANINNFWQPMLALLDHMRAEGFIHTAHQVQPLIVDKAEDIVPAIIAANGRRKAGDLEIIGKM
ncbi:conserved hypothetical protein [Brucella ceti str. Cudo]|uniref:Cytokinin riboside 5'-monophosphate phosphoribohydrolase n=9 Tax=Brucella TaxID=234 RepID=C0G4I2_9HYPH|nr:conserved hypothetical protein [Brucella ceti str. Cudo]